MELPLLGLLVFLPDVFMFQQNEYDIIFERVEVMQYNSSYVDSVRTHNFKYNRTQAAVNFTLNFKIIMANETIVEIQSYKVSSNEYRLFPIRFMFNLCEYAFKNEFGLGELFMNCGNFTCPLTKGLLKSCNWAPNSTRFPPLIPAGSYKHDLKFFFRSVEYMFLQAYGTVKYPELWKKPNYKF